MRGADPVDHFEWADFGYQKVVDPRYRGQQITMKGVASPGECKQHCEQDTRCNNVNYCKYKEGDDCNMYNRRLKEDEPTLTDPICTTHFKKPKNG